MKSMSKIKINQINEQEVVVSLSTDTPLEMVQELTKSLEDKGLYEDLAKSTLTTRYFKQHKEDVADELIKSLRSLAKDDNTWHLNKPGAMAAHNKKQRDIDLVSRREKTLIGKPDKPRTNVAPQPTAPKPMNEIKAAPEAPKSIIQSIKDKFQKDEEDMDKSGYGPKDGGQYDPKDNARRKATNIGSQVGTGPNVNVKQYTTDKFSGRTPQTDPKLKRPQPVKQFTPEQIAEENKKRGLIKSWAEHLPFPNAEEEIAKMARNSRVAQGDDAMANQLANMMNSKAMLNPNHKQPTRDEFLQAGEAMGLGVTEEMVKTNDTQWGNTFNNWIQEATKPISQRFASEEEEKAYWSRIQISDRDDGQSGY